MSKGAGTIVLPLICVEKTEHEMTMLRRIRTFILRMEGERRR